MRFDTFMQYALHDPEAGYYARKIRTVGTAGDFSTTATLSPILAHALADRAAKWLKENPGSFHLIEIGAGDGSLAKAIIAALPIMLRFKLRYHIVETSSPLIEVQQGNLHGKKVTWHSEVKQALQSANGRAFIFSNELVDAFPVRILKRSEEGWLELYWKNQQELFQACDSPPESSAINPDHPLDHRVEIHQSYLEWYESWITSWREGEMITIDYGDCYPNIYERRPMGTIRAFLMHQNLTGAAIYQNVGRQDLTADVNFTDLIQWSEDFGVETLSLISQSEFLQPYTSGSTQDFYLLHPDGPGGAFKVLTQRPSY